MGIIVFPTKAQWETLLELYIDNDPGVVIICPPDIQSWMMREIDAHPNSSDESATNRDHLRAGKSFTSMADLIQEGHIWANPIFDSKNREELEILRDELGLPRPYDLIDVSDLTESIVEHEGKQLQAFHRGRKVIRIDQISDTEFWLHHEGNEYSAVYAGQAVELFLVL
jgi:hypothetical protein